MPPPIPRPGGRAHRLTRSPLIHTLLQGMYVHILGCLGVASFTFLAYALAAAVRPAPWWNPQYSIPTLGLMLGNAVTGVAVGLGTLLDELGRGSGGDGVELMLCLGASRWEASRGAVARAAKLAMTPILNQLSVVGLVWIPGMMTGQMIAGADPAQVCVCDGGRAREGGGGCGGEKWPSSIQPSNLSPLPPLSFTQAARYQMVVMFIVSATTVSAAAACVCLAAATLVDGQARLRRDRLTERKRGGGAASRMWGRVARAWEGRRQGRAARPAGEAAPLLRA